MASTPGKQDPKWVEINDFRPGIISQAKFAYGSAGDNVDPVPWLGAPGAAQPSGTVGCIALPNGGLAPLPGVAKTVDSGYSVPAGATAYVNGAVVYAMGLSDGIVYGIEVRQATTRQFQLTSYLDAEAHTDVIKTIASAADTSGAGIGPLTGGLTRVSPQIPSTLTSALVAGTAYTSLAVTALTTAVAAGDALQVGSGATVMAATASAAATVGETAIAVQSVTPAFAQAVGTTVLDLTALDEPGQPCVALSYTFIEDSGAQIFNWLFPDPTNPGSFDLYEFTPAYNSLCILHQNRVIEVEIQGYAWVGTVAGTVTDFPTAEIFNYTDPPNSLMMGDQQEVFVPEFTGSVNAWGSIQSGELVLIKAAGGAFLISGDIDNPIITYLGGVTPTFGLINNAAQTILGLVYASFGNGVWAWQGGSTSEKISGNLNDDFFLVGTDSAIQFCAAAWGDWILLSNGWVFDTASGGWWQLSNPGFTPLYFAPQASGSGVWAIASTFLHGTDPIIALYDHTSPGNTFSWTSYPLKATNNHLCEVQELSLRAIGNGTITITLEGVDGSAAVTIPTTVTIDSDRPVLYRLGVFCAAHDVTINIVSTGAGGGPAPTIFSVGFMFVEGAPVNELGATL